MRILIDYRPALRERTGVGEYTHQLVVSLAALNANRSTQDELTIFSSSWKDRLQATIPGVRAVDWRVPVKVLNLAWHRFGSPSVERLTAERFDVVHSLTPLLIPSKRAAQVVTVHDLDFLSHPERTRAEIRRDYPALARHHVRSADGVIVPSRYTAECVERVLGVPGRRISVCSPGAPDWTRGFPKPNDIRDRYILFMGTLEPRKNVGTLLGAYARLIERLPQVPRLVLAGKATPETRHWIAAISRPPFTGRVQHVGYVMPTDRQRVYAGARLVVMPSLDEGFGLPVLESMTLGIPVIAADRGALPEVLGDAGLLVDPTDEASLAGAMERMILERELADASAERGVMRAKAFNWLATAEAIRGAYQNALEHRANRN